MYSYSGASSLFGMNILNHNLSKIREINMNITYSQLNPHSCKTYLVGIEGGNDIVLIDPVLDHVKDYLDMLDRDRLRLVNVIDTHTHADHISGGPSLKDATGCEYAMHKNAPSPCADISLEDGVEWRMLDEIPVRVMYSPGHTGDSVSLIMPDRIFTGDALFLDDGGAGRDDLPGGDPGKHWDTLQKIRALPEDLIVFPAHDYRDRKPSNLKKQKTSNPYLKERTREEFTLFLDDLKLGPADWMKDVLKANYACARDPKAAWIPVDEPACEVMGTMEKGVNEIGVGTISPSGLREKLTNQPAPLMIDVREEAELHSELGHIDGVLHIPIWQLAHRLAELEDYSDSDIVTVCRSGSRAHTAAQILTKAGFHSVNVLNGGMIAWKKAGVM